MPEAACPVTIKNMSIVSLAHGESRRENIRLALDQLPESVCKKMNTAQSVLIKPNLVHHLNQLASTHVDAVRAVVDFVRVKTQAPILVADAGYHGTKAAFRNFGYEQLPDEYPHLELFDLNDDETVSGYFIKRNGTKGEMGFSKRVTEAGFKISLANMKTHRDTIVTLTTKNWTIGTWVVKPRIGSHGKLWARWPFLHEEGSEAHHASIAELLHQQKPDLAVIDGFLAMEGDGPTTGTPVAMHLALAGDDCIAVDAIACELMGIDPKTVPYLAISAQKSYGMVHVDQVMIVGEKDWRKYRRTFLT